MKGILIQNLHDGDILTRLSWCLMLQRRRILFKRIAGRSEGKRPGLGDQPDIHKCKSYHFPLSHTLTDSDSSNIDLCLELHTTLSDPTLKPNTMPYQKTTVEDYDSGSASDSPRVNGTISSPRSSTKPYLSVLSASELKSLFNVTGSSKLYVDAETMNGTEKAELMTLLVTKCTNNPDTPIRDDYDAIDRLRRHWKIPNPEDLVGEECVWTPGCQADHFINAMEKKQSKRRTLMATGVGTVSIIAAYGLYKYLSERD